MMKGTRLIKRTISLLLLVLLFNIESFAAIVSDNDGSAFITKAEFDSLKNSFQTQIDSYNTSIDSKIDGAIAAYLSGINIKQKSQININEDGEQFIFMDPNQKNEYKTFQGSMGVKLSVFNYQSRSTSTSPDSTAFVNWESKLTSVPFLYAICRDKNENLWLHKNLDIELEIISMIKGNYLDGITNLSNRKNGLFIARSGTIDEFTYATGAKIYEWSPNIQMFLGSARKNNNGYLEYDGTYVRFQETTAIMTAISYKDYTDDKIRVLSTGAAAATASTAKKKSMPVFDMTLSKYYNDGINPKSQPNNNRYASLGAVKSTYKLVANAYNTSWESSSNIGSTANGWLSGYELDEKYKKHDLSDDALLPPTIDVAWDEPSAVKNGQGEKIRFNDGYMFIKQSANTGELEYTIDFDEPLVKPLKCFVTDKRMNLSNRETDVEKVPIRYKGVKYTNGVSLPIGISDATFSIDVKKGLDYYFFGCHSDGSGPIFKFENEAYIIRE